MIITKANIAIVLFLFLFSWANAQEITGKIIDKNTTSEAIGIPIAIKGTTNISYTNATGSYRITPESKGSITIIAYPGPNELEVTTVEYTGKSLDLGTTILALPITITTESNISVIEVSDLASIENENDNFSSVLTAGRDVLMNAAAYNLSAGRYRPRGYFNEDNEVYMNGMAMNDQDDGRVLWTAWSGLNDVLRNQNQILNLNTNDYFFGGIGGGSFVDLRASVQRTQTKAVYTFSNRSYQHRAMITHSSGMQENGWAYSVALSHRYGSQGYVKGTYFQGTSYFLSVDRKLGNKHLLNAVFFGTPQKRGRSVATVQEAYDLVGDNFYNSVWGYQNGAVRNSREYRINQPVAMLRHDWKINKKVSLLTNVGVQWGTFASTNLDWYNAPDPRPDYYRKLPSYALTPELQELVRQQYVSNPDLLQINWESLYAANASRNYTINNVNGIEGNSVSGKLASYIVMAEHFDNNKMSFTSTLNAQVTDQLRLTGGVVAQKEVVHNYREVDDLLGADFYVNYDKFADQIILDVPNAIQYDLNKPNQVLQVGDRFNYDYDLITKRYSLWSQAELKGELFDFTLAANINQQSFQREGFMRNGRFPDNSFGKGEVYNFTNYGVKGGVTFKIDGRNYIVVNGSMRTRAPYASDALLSARTRNYVVPNLENENIVSAEASYILRNPSFNGRLSAFYTTFKNQTNTLVFYLDTERTFSNYTLSNIDKRHVGIEGGFEKKLGTMLSVSLAGSIGQYIYTSRPNALITNDNNSTVTETTVYYNNYYVPNMPQTAGTLGLSYRLPIFMWLNVNLNYFANNYVETNPTRRTSLAISGLNPIEESALIQDIIKQEKLPGGYTVDVYIGKSFRIMHKTLSINLNVSNVLNNTNLITSGREQLRFDFEGKNVSRFPPRYFYAYGTNFSLNISYQL